jgi:succinate-semialdehyde dehydrogenase/glutarate-semialdehyde dehydrogenase
MGSFQTVNPKNDTPLETYETMGPAAVDRLLAASRDAGHAWGLAPASERVACLRRLGALLIADAARLGALATAEMGKPLAQAVKEVTKCATACGYYADQAAALLQDEPIRAGSGMRSYVAYRPLGPVLCIMPWNFPYWQVVRFAAPALAGGNTVILKHADNTTGVALAIQALCERAGFPAGVFQTLILGHEELGEVIAGPIVRAVSLTGSERAGSAVAARAGAALKRTVLELGGSDPYVVLKDADIAQAARISVEARLVNSGQSCVAAKRFIVEEPVYGAFLEAFVAAAKEKVVGDPEVAATDVGPLAKPAILAGVETQVQKSIAAGAKARLGGRRIKGPGCFFEVTVLDGVVPGMPAFDEEVFGPAAALIRAKDEQEALALANRSRYGLGGAIFSQDVRRAEELAVRHLEAGFVAVNGMVQSDARLPFGGVKRSGYGRELGSFGLREFLNVKTVTVATP